MPIYQSLVMDSILIHRRGTLPMTGRAHCQRQVAFLKSFIAIIKKKGLLDSSMTLNDTALLKKLFCVTHLINLKICNQNSFVGDHLL